MDFTELSYEQDEFIYNTLLPNDFPSGEVKPWSVVSSLIKRGLYKGYALYEEGDVQAYAFMSGNAEYCLLDYFAVISSCRGKGVGSEFLQRLAKLNGRNIIIEVERISCAKNEIDRIKRERRIEFYKRNNVTMTTIEAVAFGQPYSVMCLSTDGKIDEAVLCRDYEGVYRTFTDNFERDISIE